MSTFTQSSRSKEKDEIALDPSWGEILHRLRRISPYLWPSKSRALQFLAVRALYSFHECDIVNLVK